MIDEILCTVTPAETRIALMDDGRVAELFIELTARPAIVGNIYLGRVARVLKGISSMVSSRTQAGQTTFRGKATYPQALHRLPMR